MRPILLDKDKIITIDQFEIGKLKLQQIRWAIYMCLFFEKEKLDIKKMAIIYQH